MSPAATLENNKKSSYDVKDAMNILFSKLDEAIDDVAKIKRYILSHFKYRQLIENGCSLLRRTKI